MKSGMNTYKLLLWCYLICSIMPIVAQITRGYFLMLLTLGILLSYLFFNKNLVNKTSCYLYPFLCMCLLEIFFIFLTQGLAIIDMYSCIVGYMPVILTFFVFYLNKKEIKETIILLFILYLLTSITSILVLNIDSNASRYLATGAKGEYTDYLNLRNVGDYSIVYSLVLLIPLLIFLYKRTIINRVMLLIALAIFSWFIIQAEFMYAILFGIVAICTIFYSKDITIKKCIGYLALLLLLLIVFSDIISQLCFYLAENSTSLSIGEKLRSIANFFAGEEMEGADALGRIELYKYSWNKFLESPLIGNFYREGQIGGHSYILDTMAKFGIIGLGLLIWIYRTIYNFTIKPYKSCKGIGYFVIVYILSILLSLINTGSWINVLFLYSTLITRFVFADEMGGGSF